MLAIIRSIVTVINTFFVYYMIFYSSFLFLAAIVGSIILYRNRYRELMHSIIKHDYYVPVSILVPAYNEEKVIIASVKSLLGLDYKLYEIIVINDGSSDKTVEELINEFDLKESNAIYQKQIPTKTIRKIYETKVNNITIKVIDKENGGKSDSLNAGINASSFPFFVALDADSFLQKDLLERIIKPVLEEENVIACGGFIRLSNSITMKDGEVTNFHLPNKLLIAMQILEYDRSFLASRIFFDEFNGNLIISGAFGLFKKDIVISCGGYSTDTVGEDFEIVSKMHVFCKQNNMDYKIKYVSDAICWTQAPSSLRDLKKQRKRWFNGLIQCMSKYRFIFANSKYGVLNFSYIYYLFYELFAPLIEVFGIISMIVSLLIGALNVTFMIQFYGLYLLFGALSTLTVFFSRVHLMKNSLSVLDVVRAIVACICETVVLRFILTFARVQAFLSSKKRKMKWDKLKRQEIKI